MKIVKVVVVLFFLSVFSIYAQEEEKLHFNYQVIYELTYQPDSANQSFQKIDLELLTNNKGSLFRSIQKGTNDSILYAENKTPKGMMVVRPVNKFNYQIIKSDGNIKTYDFPFGPSLEGKEDIYYYDEKKVDLDWQIKEDTLTINGMLCQRADLFFGGRQWVSWFAPEIPISDGPYKFCGLPGLIVTIYDTKESWKFDLVNIRNIDKEVVIHFGDWLKFTSTTKEAFFKERRAYQNNLFSTLEAAGNRFENPVDKAKNHEWFRDDVNKRMAADNNWIELDMR